MSNKDWTGNGNSIWKTLGASNHTDKEREAADFYATSDRALNLFAPIFPIHHKVYECACGNGSLSKWLVEHGHDVLSTDIVDRGYGLGGVDFLRVGETADVFGNGNVYEDVIQQWMAGEPFDILTNPPYSKSTPFILHALDLIPDDGHVIMFLKTTFLEGKQRRKLIYDVNLPRYVFQFSERILCAKNGDFEGMRAAGGSACSYMWAVWNKYNNDKICEVKWI